MSDKQFKNQLEKLVLEIEQLDYSTILDWVEKNIIDIPDPNIFLYCTGGPAITIFVDSGVLKGVRSFSAPILLNCNTTIFRDFINGY